MEQASGDDIPGNPNDQTENAVSRSDSKAEEDVPEDFFDDFLKEDFMAGLDIVDEDNNLGDVTEKPNEKAKKPKVQQKNRRKLPGKIDHVKKFRDSPPGVKTKGNPKKLTKVDSELKRLDKELDEFKKEKPLKKTDKQGVDADSFDIRRDPEKTRQAIERDKMKNAKDKEKRRITDIVETGLVPPGMEFEIDLDAVCKTEPLPVISDLREKIRSRKSKSKSPLPKRRRSARKSVSPAKPKKARSPKLQPSGTDLASNVSGNSRNRSPLTRNRSPLKRSPIPRRSPRRSPVRRIVRSPLYRPPLRRSRSPRLNRRSPSPRRRSRSSRRSPLYRKSRSRDRSLSFRRRRDRSYSPMGRRRRSRSRSPKKAKKDDKPSFLEELVAKLNETHPLHQPQPPVMPMMQPMISPVSYMQPQLIPPRIPLNLPPVVQPGPPPNNFFVPQTSTPAPQPQLAPQQTQKYDPYDESFFIGSSSPAPAISEKPGLPSFTSKNGTSRMPRFEGKDFAKLFGDQRIKLSDFLAITSKPKANNQSSAKLHEKIKVIQRCQDAVKVLNEKRFTGPLVVQKTNTYQYSKDMTISPLLRKPIVQLPFTTPGVVNSSEMNFAKCCETLLYRIGIDKNLTESRKPEKAVVVPSKYVPRTEAPPTAIPFSHSEPKNTIKAVTKCISIQTEKELSMCKDCLRRKSIMHSNCAVQAGNPMLTFSVSTQVTEADFYSMIPRNQSLASLTPAQLLGKQSMITDLTKMSSGNFDSRHGRNNMTAQEILTRARQNVPSPPPPPVMMTNPASLQTDAYPPPLFSSTSLAALMALRTTGSGSSFGNDRKGGFSNRY